MFVRTPKETFTPITFASCLKDRTSSIKQLVEKGFSPYDALSAINLFDEIGLSFQMGIENQNFLQQTFLPACVFKVSSNGTSFLNMLTLLHLWLFNDFFHFQDETENEVFLFSLQKKEDKIEAIVGIVNKEKETKFRIADLTQYFDNLDYDDISSIRKIIDYSCMIQQDNGLRLRKAKRGFSLEFVCYSTKLL